MTEQVRVDNQKTAVILHKVDESVQFNSLFLDLAGHYGFWPQAAGPIERIPRARTNG